jgi:ADP-ribose pyrophosphatase
MKQIVYKDKYRTIEKETAKVRGKRIEVFRDIKPDFVVIVPRLKNGDMLLERQYRHQIKKYMYEFPAGMIEPGEKPMDAARRELGEETGYKANKLRFLFKVYWAPGSSTHRALFYYAERVEKGGARRLDKTEIIRMLEVSEKKLEGMIRDGRIVDTKTLLAFLYYKRYFGGF